MFIPLRLPLAQAEAFYDRNEARILALIERAKTEGRQWTTGEKIAWAGGALTLVRDDSIKQTTRIGDNLYIPASVRDPHAAFRRWIRAQAPALLQPRVQYWAQRTQTQYSGLRYFFADLRMGTCSVRKEIRLNYKLVCLPPDVWDMVIVHELMHTLCMDHSARFHRLMDIHYPDWRVVRKRMRDGIASLRGL